MTGHDEIEPASPKRRAAARAVDMVVTAVWAAVVLSATSLTAGIVTLYVDGGVGYGGRDTLAVWGTLFSLLAVVPIAYYEVSTTARHGQTFGKRAMGLRVVQHEDPDASSGDPRLCDLRQSIVRWVIPHGAGSLVGVVALLVAIPRIKDYGGYVGVGAGVAVWAVVYASSLLDRNGRGWHDKAAGTVVVAAPGPSSNSDSGGDGGAGRAASN